MLNNGNKQSCEFANEIVSYIYDETGVAERKVFETHLTECHECTNEFADISDARFSVFEWRREEFAHLSTPEIVIPYDSKPSVVEENASAGLLAGLRGLLSITNWPVAVAAALLICFGVGFIALNQLDGNQEIASNAKVNESVPPVVTQDNSAKVDPQPSATQETGTTTVANDNTSDRELRPVKAIETHKLKSNSHTTTERQKTANNYAAQTPQVRKAPVLSNFDDNDDKSLRLTDLFDGEIGTRR